MPALELHALTFVPEGDEVLVGRPGTDAYAVLPADGAALLQRMADGDSPSAAADWYADNYGHTVDIAEFVESLDELGFLRRAGEDAQAAPGPVRLQRLARALFSPVAFVVYAVIVVAWIANVVAHPDFAPHPRQVFFTQ